jgi:hypothetical protein
MGGSWSILNRGDNRSCDHVAADAAVQWQHVKMSELSSTRQKSFGSRGGLDRRRGSAERDGENDDFSL